MEIVYLPKADEDLEYWVQTGNKAVLKKIAQLTEAIILQATSLHQRGDNFIFYCQKLHD